MAHCKKRKEWMMSLESWQTASQCTPPPRTVSRNCHQPMPRRVNWSWFFSGNLSLNSIYTIAVARTLCPQRQQMCIAIPYTGSQQLQMNRRVCITQVQNINLRWIKTEYPFLCVCKTYKIDTYVLSSEVNYFCFNDLTFTITNFFFTIFNNIQYIWLQ